MAQPALFLLLASIIVSAKWDSTLPLMLQPHIIHILIMASKYSNVINIPHMTKPLAKNSAKQAARLSNYL